jgi:hypothetical protein
MCRAFARRPLLAARISTKRFKVRFSGPPTSKDPAAQSGQILAWIRLGTYGLQSGTATVFGRGENPINLVSVRDIAQFVELAVIDRNPGRAPYAELVTEMDGRLASIHEVVIDGEMLREKLGELCLGAGRTRGHRSVHQDQSWAIAHLVECDFGAVR